MGFDAVLDGIVSAVNNAINAQGITQRGQVGKGWPVATEITPILAQSDNEWQVSVYPLPGSKNVTRNRPEYAMIPKPNVTLTASVTNNLITFAGTPQAGLNIHAFCDAPLPDTWYVTNGQDTLASIAFGVAGSINAAGRPGLSATATGAVVTVTGCKTLRVTIGGSETAVIGREVGRIERVVQVSVWASNDAVRALVFGAIQSGVGMLDSRFFTLADGTDYGICYESDTWSDESQSSYSLYVSHTLYRVEFGITQTVTATQVGSVIASTTDGSMTPVVGYSAGP